MDDDRALKSAEFAAWLPIMAMLELLPSAIGGALQRATGQTLVSLYVLGHLERQTSRSAGVSELAACTSTALPRMSRILGRMEADGLVTRSGCATDGRAVTMTLTPLGEETLRVAMPHHDQVLREHLFDAVTPEQLSQLRTIAMSLTERLHPDTASPIDRQRHESAA